jgi:hypothetical protein
MPKKNNHTHYVVTSFYFCAQEDSDSDLSVIGCYQTHQDAMDSMTLCAEEELKLMIEKEIEAREETRTDPENLSLSETETEIVCVKKNVTITHTKSHHKIIFQRTSGIIVCNAADDIYSDTYDDIFCYAGTIAKNDYIMYKIHEVAI